MIAADLMETHIDVADICTGADEAWDHMRRHDLQSLVVTDQGRIAGVVSRARLDGTRGKAHRRDRTLGEYLPQGPVTITADYPIARAVSVLEGDVAGCVPVLERGRLVGVLTITGLLRRRGMKDARSRAS